MIRYIVLTTVVAFLSIVILILHFYLKNNKYEAEIESERIEEVWELRKNLEIDLREANDMGAFKSYEY
jgi:predicted Holliday junction resolvase-like endonuclease